MSAFLQNLIYGKNAEVLPPKQNLTRLSPQASRQKRAEIAEDTIHNSASVIEAYASRGASKSGRFYPSLPNLSSAEWREKKPGFKPSPERKTKVVVADSFVALRQILAAGAEPEKTAVLNLASDIKPGGGWDSTLSETQEEALCYSSTLFATLDPKWYPWDNASAAGAFSPGVVVYKDTIANECRMLPKEEVVVTGVITVAAPRWRPLTIDRTEFRERVHLEQLREKIRAVYRMAAVEGRTNIVLGAMGCGAYGCPKERVAKEMRDILLEDEFAGWFERVWWAVFDPFREGNSGVFGEICDGIEIK